MKKKLQFIFLWTLSSVITVFLFTTCSKSSDENSHPTLPAAQAANDSKSGGIYKGAIVGSSGHIAVVLQEGVNKVYLTIDGVEYTLTTTAAIPEGKAIVGALFTGSGISLLFSVDSNGNNSAITALTIPAHPDALAQTLKEKSNDEVRVYEGRYTKTSGASSDHCTGNLNIIANGSRFIATYKEDIITNPTSAGSFTGPYSGSQISYTISSSEMMSVTISSDKQSLSGTFTADCSSSISCMRTM